MIKKIIVILLLVIIILFVVNMIKNKKKNENTSKTNSNANMNIKSPIANMTYNDLMSATVYNSRTQNDPGTLMEQGYKYARGENVPKDLNKALEYFKKAESLGETQASVEIGYVYLSPSVNKDDLAFKQFLKALDSGNDDGFNGIVDYYKKTKPNNAVMEYTNFLKRRLDINPKDAATLFRIGYEHYLEDGYMEYDPFIAVQYFETAAVLDYSNAYDVLGDIYLNGEGNVNRDVNKAYQCYTSGAKLNNPHCNYILGKLMTDQKSGIYDFDRGVKYLRKACDLGEGDAYFELGTKYYFGMCGRTQTDAIEMYKKAVELGCEPAQFALGNHYFETGEYSKAMPYLKMCADRGSEKAIEYIRIINSKK